MTGAAGAQRLASAAHVRAGIEDIPMQVGQCYSFFEESAARIVERMSQRRGLRSDYSLKPQANESVRRGPETEPGIKEHPWHIPCGRNGMQNEPFSSPGTRPPSRRRAHSSTPGQAVTVFHRTKVETRERNLARLSDIGPIWRTGSFNPFWHVWHTRGS